MDFDVIHGIESDTRMRRRRRQWRMANGRSRRAESEVHGNRLTRSTGLWRVHAVRRFSLGQWLSLSVHKFPSRSLFVLVVARFFARTGEVYTRVLDLRICEGALPFGER